MNLSANLSAKQGRLRRRFAYALLCAIVALFTALLLAGREAQAQQVGDATNGVAQQSGDAEGGAAPDQGYDASGGAQASDSAAGYGDGLSLEPAAPETAPVPAPQTGIYDDGQAIVPAYQAPPEPATTMELPSSAPVASVQQVAEPVVQTVAPVVEPVARTLAPAVEPVLQTVEPVQEALRSPTVEQVNRAVKPAVEPVVQAAAPTVEPNVQRIPDLATSTLPRADHAPAGAETEPRTITGADSVHPFAVTEHLEGTVPHPPAREQIPPAVTELSGLRGLLDERVVALAGQQLLAGAGPGAEGASSRAPLPLGSVPAGAGSSGGLGGSGFGVATGLAALALLLFLLRVGGSLSWSWCELLGPSWAPIAITERPG